MQSTKVAFRFLCMTRNVQTVSCFVRARLSSSLDYFGPRSYFIVEKRDGRCSVGAPLVRVAGEKMRNRANQLFYTVLEILQWKFHIVLRAVLETVLRRRPKVKIHWWVQPQSSVTS